MPSSGMRRQTTWDLVQARKDEDRLTSSDTSRSRRCEVMQISCCSGHVFAEPRDSSIDGVNDGPAASRFQQTMRRACRQCAVTT